MSRLLIPLFGSLLAAGCILETNPDYGGAAGSGSGGATDGNSAGTDTGMIPDLPDAGCTDPNMCTELHVGLTADSCPHTTDSGDTTACDLEGYYAVRIAARLIENEGGGHIVVHDNNGGVAEYAGDIRLSRNSWLSPPDGVPPSRVVLHCFSAQAGITFEGDSIRVERLTVAGNGGCTHTLRTRTDPAMPGSETGGHLIQEIIGIAHAPEIVGNNSVEGAIDALGPDSVLLNSYFWGYHNGTVQLGQAHRTRVVGNTFVIYQEAASNQLFDVSAAIDLTFGNNVVVSLTNSVPTAILASSSTTGTVIAGNVIEGFDSLVTGLPGTGGNVDEGNTTIAEVESPRIPLFLSDSTLAASPMVALQGTSIDGADRAGHPDPLPGAFQVRSGRSGPRRMVIAVGPGDDACGGPCDVVRGELNELQLAAWNAWPGSTIELHPSPEAYAGPAMVSWPVTIRGVGPQPDDVRVTAEIEDGDMSRWGQFSFPGLIWVSQNLSDPVTIENLTVDVGLGYSGVVVEGSGDRVPPTGPNRVRRVRVIESAGTDAVFHGFYLGDEVVLQDSIVVGEFVSCVRFGVRAGAWQDIPRTSSHVSNLTCRLTGIEAGQSDAAFDVAGVDAGVLANIVVEMPSKGALFRAQRESSGDDDPLADAFPTAFVVNALTGRGWTTQFDGFTVMDGAYDLIDFVELLPADPLFASPTNSMLDPMSSAVDSGQVVETVDAAFVTGLSLDGVEREGRATDRGAYEQGL